MREFITQDGNTIFSPEPAPAVAANPDITDPALRQPIATAPRDGTVIQIGGPYEWVRCHWDQEGRFFAAYAPDTMKDGSAFDMKDKKFWRPDYGKG